MEIAVGELSVHNMLGYGDVTRFHGGQSNIERNQLLMVTLVIWPLSERWFGPMEAR